MCWYSAGRNPQTSPHFTCQTRTCHSAGSIAHTTCSLCLLTCPFPLQPPLAPPLWVSDWQEVRDTVKSCLSVPDPLQRDANQVHLPATQRLLAAHHASEQRGRSLQLPRYGRVLLMLIVIRASSLFLSRFESTAACGALRTGVETANVASSSEGISTFSTTLLSRSHLFFLGM